MGLKDLLFKQNESKDIGDVSSILNSLPSTETLQNDSSPINLTDIQSIDDLYNSLGKTSNKIYDVIPFIDSLPSTMSMIDKKSSLVKILQAAKYDIDELKGNADECLNALSDASTASVTKLEEDKTSYSKQISDKYAEIDELKKLIAEEEKRNGRQLSLFNQEMERLKNIKGYLE